MSIFNIKKTIITSLFILVILLTSNAIFAQQEIPEEIKGLIAQGINTLESAKSSEDIDTVIEIFKKAVNTIPNYPDAHYYLGKTYSMVQGNAGRAVKELKKYLELYPNAPDNEKVMKDISQLEETIKTKRKFNLAGIELISLSDGVYVRSIYPNCPYDRLTARGGGVRIHDKIVKIGDVDVSGLSLQAVLSAIESDTSQKYVNVTVERGGTLSKTFLLKNISNRYENFRDLGEDDLSEIITDSKELLLMVFGTDWDEKFKPCIPVIGSLVNTYKDKVSVITVSVNENRTIAKEYNITEVPVTLIYKNGKKIDEIKGCQGDLIKEKVNVLINK